MSLIHSAELAKENPFEYLTALQQSADAAKANPVAWMPWFFRASLASTASGTGAGLGYSSLGLQVPNDPALQGVTLATQAWFLDPAATDGVTHTDGVEMTFGN